MWCYSSHYSDQMPCRMTRLSLSNWICNLRCHAYESGILEGLEESSLEAITQTYSSQQDYPDARSPFTVDAANENYSFKTVERQVQVDVASATVLDSRIWNGVCRLSRPTIVAEILPGRGRLAGRGTGGRRGEHGLAGQRDSGRFLFRIKWSKIE